MASSDWGLGAHLGHRAVGHRKTLSRRHYSVDLAGAYIFIGKITLTFSPIVLMYTDGAIAALCSGVFSYGCDSAKR
jgi:hypothetical protein